MIKFTDLGYDEPTFTEEICHYCGKGFQGDMVQLRAHYALWEVPGFKVHCSDCSDTHINSVIK